MDQYILFLIGAIATITTFCIIMLYLKYKEIEKALINNVEEFEKFNKHINKFIEGTFNIESRAEMRHFSFSLKLPVEVRTYKLKEESLPELITKKK